MIHSLTTMDIDPLIVFNAASPAGAANCAMLMDELMCPICLDVFKYPMTTTCGHTFCLSCLYNAFLKTSCCPVCKKNTMCCMYPNQVIRSLSHIVTRATNQLQLTSMKKCHCRVEVLANTAHENLVLDSEKRALFSNNSVMSPKPMSKKLSILKPGGNKRFLASVCALSARVLDTSYFTFDVSSKDRWTLGVCVYSIPRSKAVVLSPCHEVWAVGLREGTIYSYLNPERVPLTHAKVNIVGIHIDVPKREMTIVNGMTGEILLLCINIPAYPHLFIGIHAQTDGQLKLDPGFSPPPPSSRDTAALLPPPHPSTPPLIVTSRSNGIVSPDNNPFSHNIIV